jgi:hypothetical protein
MSVESDKQVRNVKRIMLHRAYYSRFMSFWAFSAVALFVFFGIRPLIGVMIEKKDLITEMQEINANLSNNNISLSIVQYELEKAADNLQYIDYYMPTSFKPEDYLLDLTYAASTAGFSVVRYSIGEVNIDTGGLRVRAKLEGRGDTANLIKNIEEMKRVTYINKLRFTPKGEEEAVTIDLEIFKSEELVIK